MSKRFINPPYSISRATAIDSRIVVAYPRSAFSATKRVNHAPNSFDQQDQVLKATRHVDIREIETLTSIVVEALSW